MQRALRSPSRSEAAARGAPFSPAAPDVGLRRELGPAAMRLHVRREAMLAERAAQHYSVVVLEVRNAAVRAAHGLWRALRGALQPGDEIGWLDDRRLALSLPLTDPATAAARASRLGSAARRLPRAVYSQFAPLSDPSSGQSPAGEPAPVPVRPLGALLRNPLPRWKRLVDIVGAIVGLVLTAPVMLVAAVLVRFSSPGEVIFRQRRAGLHGVPFGVYKFRTMVRGAEARKAELLAFNERSGPVFKMTNDPRVTRIGRLLRATSIDELPQLWNVLRGDMSLVGPRPPTLDEVSRYRQWHWRRLAVLPGITCTWQVSARDGVDFDDWVRMDLRYLEHRTLFGDLRLLWATIPAVLSRRGAR
jgi:lipopolysaccharide/colanic/teichoic acid biosynthesis glycosyltransferase